MIKAYKWTIRDIRAPGLYKVLLGELRITLNVSGLTTLRSLFNNPEKTIYKKKTDHTWHKLEIALI